MMQVNFDATQSTMPNEDSADATDTLNTATGAIEMQPMQAESVADMDGEYIHELNVRTDLPVTETVASDSNSSPAIADDLLNGCSQETKIDNELDAEMVSEDELPVPSAPVQPTDLSDLSDEELPGPKRAELPADTEVVSEDEFPSTNKVKRKAEENHDVDSLNEDVDTPKKRAKTELDSMNDDFYYSQRKLNRSF